MKRSTVRFCYEAQTKPPKTRGFHGLTGEIKPYSKGILVRDVPIPPYTLEAVKEAKISKKGKTCGHNHREGVCRSTLVLTKPGVMVDANNWRKRVWNPALKNVGVEPTTIHDMRYTYASRLAQAGIPLAEVGRLLGHHAESVTRRYAHLAAVPEDKILNALKM